MVHAYIGNTYDETVSVIDTVSNTVVATIPLGSAPVVAVAISPYGNTIYVAYSSNIAVIDSSSNAVVATIPVSYSSQGVAITPDGNYAYVTTAEPSTGDNNITVINTASNSVDTTISLSNGTAPLGVAVTPDGRYVYVCTPNTGAGSNTVTVIDTSDNSIYATISLPSGGATKGLAITPDGTTVYVTDPAHGKVYYFATGSTSPTINTITLPSGSFPIGIAITPDNTYVYVANGAPSGGNNVFMFPTGTNSPTVTSISVGSQPTCVGVTPDGSTAYVANTGSGPPYSNTVSYFAAENTSPTVNNITVGNGPVALGLFIQPPSIPMTNTYTAPQGRLTLTSNTPVMTADAIGQTSVYYTPYQGNIVPIYDGANMQSYTFGQLTMALDTSNQLSGKLYDLFAFLNSGVVTIGAGPAWSSSTSRGTGSGTTQLQQIDGLWANANAITPTNGSTTYGSISAGQATYLGTVYMTANGQTGMQFKPAEASGGTNNILGLYNAYNRVTASSRSIDSTATWTYSTAAVRPANNSTSNRINWVDGLQQSFVRVEYQVQASCSSGNDTFVYIGLDSTTTPQFGAAGVAVAITTSIRAASDIPPQLGFHYVQALENTGGGTGVTFYGGNHTMDIKTVLEM